MARAPRRLPFCLPALLLFAGIAGLATAAEQAPAPPPAEPPPAKGVSAFEYFFEKKQPPPAPVPAPAAPAAQPAPAAPAPQAAPSPPAPAAQPAAPQPEDAIEMATYYMVLLKRGPAWTPEETPAVAKLQEGHMANIRRLAREGKLILAGPFLEQTGKGSLAGIFLFRVGSRAEAEALTATDPAVQAGRLVPEILPWLGPKTLHY